MAHEETIGTEGTRTSGVAYILEGLFSFAVWRSEDFLRILLLGTVKNIGHTYIADR